MNSLIDIARNSLIFNNSNNLSTNKIINNTSINSVDSINSRESTHKFETNKLSLACKT